MSSEAKVPLERAWKLARRAAFRCAEGHRVQESSTVVLRFNPAVKHHDSPPVASAADQASEALLEPQNCLGQCIFVEGIIEENALLGKGRKGRERKTLLEKEIIRPGEEKRKYRKRGWYIRTRSSSKRLRSYFPLLFKGKDFIQERFDKKGEPVIVLDWGCGRGNTITGFAKEYDSKIKAYGFSKDSYKEWQKIDNVKLIHSTDMNLLRYLKNNSVDLIYSRFGLYHMFLSSSLLSSSSSRT